MRVTTGLRSVLLIVWAAHTMACETNPYTHRTQLLAVPKGYETNLGAQAYQQVLHDPKVKVSQDPHEVDPVRRVADNIIRAAKESRYPIRQKNLRGKSP